MFLVDQELEQVWNVSVRYTRRMDSWCIIILLFYLEPCEENNSGCEANAICSTQDKSVVVKRTCKDGFVPRGSGTVVQCISELFSSVEIVYSRIFQFFSTSNQ